MAAIGIGGIITKGGMRRVKAKGVLLVGLDGATWKLLDKWIAAGELPNLARMCSNGVKGTLLSTVPSTTCPALPVLFTGKNPGNLGVFTFSDYRGNLVTLASYSDAKLWDVLGDQGKATCAVSVRFVYPVPRINGVITCSTPLPPNAENLYYPPNLDEIIGRKVPLNTGIHDRIYSSPDFRARKDEILGVLREFFEERHRLITDLSEKRDFDLVFTWFSAIDMMQHIYWDDPDTLLRHYKDADLYLGKLLDLCKGWDAMVISDHGFHCERSKSFKVNTWLMSRGFIFPSSGRVMRWLSERAIRVYRLIVRTGIYRRLLRRKKSEPVAGDGKDTVLKDRYKNTFPAIDWSRSTAYMFNDWGVSIIRENLSEDYEEFRSRLISEMKSVVDDEGRQVFPHVWKKEELFSGKYIDQIPDVIYQTDERYRPDSLITSGRLYEKFVRGTKYPWTGAHEGDRRGIFIGCGPSFERGKTIPDSEIYDIAPTLYHLLGCRIPDDLDGKIILEALNEETRERKPEYYHFTDSGVSSGGKEVSAEDEESIKQQLKDMGYLS